MPVTPKVAFVLMHKDDKEGIFHENRLFVPNISEENLINTFNEKALEYEQQWSNEFVVAKRRNELEYLQNIVARK